MTTIRRNLLGGLKSYCVANNHRALIDVISLIACPGAVHLLLSWKSNMS